MIEFMIASLVGLIIIGTVGTLFIKGQSAAAKRNQELKLLQNMNSSMQMLKSDLYRAGFDGGSGHSIKLSGATNTIYSQSSATKGLVAYAYYTRTVGVDKKYKSVVYEQPEDSNQLYICEKELNLPISTVQALDFSNQVGSCYSLFDEKQIKVNSFNISESELKTSAALSSVITLSLDAELVNENQVQETLSVSLKQRNWQ